MRRHRSRASAVVQKVTLASEPAAAMRVCSSCSRPALNLLQQLVRQRAGVSDEVAREVVDVCL